MTSQFITNQDKLLSEVIDDILPSTKAAHFLVGYFYFSGFQEIYKGLKGKKVRVLVGLEIEKKINEQMAEFQDITSGKCYLSRETIKDNFYSSYRAFFNESDYFDTEEKQAAFRVFIEKIHNGSLEIRKTKEPNHAKLYLFEKKAQDSEGGDYPGVVITGSSNLSFSGLSGRYEINAIFRDKNSYDEARTIFEDLWHDSVEVAGPATKELFEKEVLEKIWHDKQPDPFLMYLRVLEEYFAYAYEGKIGVRYPSQITKDKYHDLKYQIDAINEALSIIDTHNGIIVADVVGLGKSIIAATIAHNLNLKTIVIAPPHLEEQWRGYTFEFHFVAEFCSSGKIEDALRFTDDQSQKLIIIDEAHKYRNELTQDYKNLWKLCKNNKVILLTATPYNNTPEDIFSMIKLFQIPQNSTIKTEKNLSHRFIELIREYKDIKKAQKERKENETSIKRRIMSVTDKIRGLIAPLVIRRSRLDLLGIEEYKEDLIKQKFFLPKVADPKLMEYELGDVQSLYLKTLDKIAPDEEAKGFIGARYKPTSYLKNSEKYKKIMNEELGDENLFRQTQKNLAKFMKFLLVKRFESSVAAFECTLKNMIHSMDQMRLWYEEKGQVPIYKKGHLPEISENFTDFEGEDVEKETDKAALEDEIGQFNADIKALKAKGLHLIPKVELKPEFIEDLKGDIKLLKKIQKDWFSGEQLDDPKFDFFQAEIKKLRKAEPNRKIVIFSEFSDTAKYIHKKLNNERAFLYTSAQASHENRRIVKHNFDAECPVGKQEDKYDLLIATDTLSEGVNLHRAGTVINYDIPFNPTRVIQRLGRINRIGKKVFDLLYTYNFFPTITGENVVGVRRIASLKMAMIQALLGEDTKILTPEETPESFYEKQKGAYRKQLLSEINGDSVSWDTPHKDLLKKIKKHHPALLKTALELPKRSRIGRDTKNDEQGVLVFGKKGDDSTFWFGKNSQDQIPLQPSEALELFKADEKEKGKPLSPQFWSTYSKTKEQLFKKSSDITRDKAYRETLDKIDYLLDKFPKERSYLEDLKFIFEKLGDLSGGHAKQIRAIHEQTLKEDFAELQKELPHSILLNVINQSKKIDDGDQRVILAEEFC